LRYEGLKHRPEYRYLVSEVGVPKDKLGRMLTAFPQRFGLSVEPFVWFLWGFIAKSRLNLQQIDF